MLLKILKQIVFFKEALIKSGAQIAQSDFSSDCIKTTQEYLIVFKVKISLWSFGAI